MMVDFYIFKEIKFCLTFCCKMHRKRLQQICKSPCIIKAEPVPDGRGPKEEFQFGPQSQFMLLIKYGYFLND